MTTTEPVESMDGRTVGTFSEVYSDALRGESCTVRGIDQDQPLPVHDWVRPVSHSDRVVLGHCQGATLDVGCGPGRMGAHLAELGHVVLGVDIVHEAVDQARRRGVSALRRNVFDPLPGEGRWNTVLLADGNIGIGGAPLKLLRRASELLDRAGRVVCDLAPPGTGLLRHQARLVTDLKRSGSFPWAQVGPEAIEQLSDEAGLLVEHLNHHDDRWFAVLSR